MRTLRMLVGLLFLGVLASYLLLAGELIEEAQWATVGALGVLGLAWVRLGGAPARRPLHSLPKPRWPRPPRKQTPRRPQTVRPMHQNPFVQNHPQPWPSASA